MIKHRRDLWKLITVEGDACEVGCAEGLFSADILQWPVNFKQVHLVDRWECQKGQKGDGGHPQEWHHENYRQAHLRIENLGKNKSKKANFIRMDSVAAAEEVQDRTLSLLYIDADHSYQGVMADLNAWVPKVMKGGVVALHDYESPQYGVKKAVRDFCNGVYEVLLLPEDNQCDAGAYFYV